MGQRLRKLEHLAEKWTLSDDKEIQERNALKYIKNNSLDKKEEEFLIRVYNSFKIGKSLNYNKTKYINHLYKTKGICGYIRKPRINRTHNTVSGLCLLTKNKCEKEIPFKQFDCQSYKKYFSGKSDI